MANSLLDTMARTTNTLDIDKVFFIPLLHWIPWNAKIVIEVHGHKSLISVEYEKSAAYIHNKINKYDDAILRICRRKPHIAALSSQKGWFDAQWPNIQNYTETWPCICFCVSFGSSDAVTSNHRFVELSTASFCNQWTFCLIEFSDISLAWQYLVDGSIGFVMWWVWDMLH